MGDGIMAEEEKGTQSEDEQLVEEMLSTWESAVAAESSYRKLALEDLKFDAAFDANGVSTHWTADELQERKEDGVPSLTLDHFSQFPKQVVNDFRQMKMGGQVNPVDSGADPLTAEALQGIIRTIEQNSHASVAYETGYDFAVKAGFGFWRLLTKLTYDSPRNRQEWNAQHIEIESIKNPFTVYGDPMGESPDGSDWDCCHIVERMREADYRRKYKKSELASLSDWSSLSGLFPVGWLLDGMICVGEWFHSKHKDEKALLLSDGSVVLKKTLDSNVAKYGNAGLPVDENGRTVTIADERMVDTRTIHWIKSNGKEVLERTDWPGKWIPVIPVYGMESNIDGKLNRYGMIRTAKDPQRALNYMFSAAVGAVGLAPKAPWLAYEGTFEKHAEIWAMANKKNFSVLPVTPKIVDNVLLPLPQRASYEPAIGAMVSMINHLQYTLKATQGMYGSSLGEPSGEKSGIAIQSRQSQGDKATFHYPSNAERSLWHTYRSLLDLIPKVYDNQTVLQILGKEDEKRTIKLDHNLPPEQREAAAEEPIPRFNITAGRYDVTISIGQAYATQRQETIIKLSEVLKTWGSVMPPQAMQVMLTKLLKSLDIPGGQEMADAVEEAMASLQPSDAIPPQVQQQMQAMGQQLQLMAQELQKAKERENAKVVELTSREKIERMREDSQENIAAINAEIEIMRIRSQAAMKGAELDNRAASAELDATAEIAIANIQRLREPNQPEEEPAMVTG